MSPRLLGVLLTMLLHLLFLGVPTMLEDAGVDLSALPWVTDKRAVPIFAIGLFQIPYVAAAWALLRWLGYGEVAKGVVRGALLTVLVNAGACGALYLALANAHF
jgi:hypothetical protein